MNLPDKPNEGWAMDFMSDWVVNMEKKQESVRLLNVVDECSRKALWTEAHKSIPAKTLISCLNHLIQARGKPSYIRCDNGPEFISKALSKWAEAQNIDIFFIQPGKPTQNAIIERLNGTLRTECLNLHWFQSIHELNAAIQHWSVCYNTVRPHSSLNNKTPDELEQGISQLCQEFVA